MFILDPKMHQIRQVLWTTITFSYELHSSSALVVFGMCGLENEGSAEIVHGCDAYLSVWIKDEFDPQDGCDGFSEFGTFGSEYLKLLAG